MKELWKDIAGYEGKYQISNLGRVRSLLNSRGNKREQPKILKTSIDRWGYLVLALCKNSTGKMFKVHRLVAQAFLLNPENKPEVNHKDGNKLNNTALNLEWVTPKENIRHAFKTGLRKKGEESHRAKLTNEQVRQIRKEYIPCSRGFSTRALARKYNVSQSNIYLIIKNRAYKDIN